MKNRLTCTDAACGGTRPDPAVDFRFTGPGRGFQPRKRPAGAGGGRNGAGSSSRAALGEKETHR